MEFRAVRVACGLSAKEAAEEIGISKSYVVAAERSVADVPRRLAEWAEGRLVNTMEQVRDPRPMTVPLGGSDAESRKYALVAVCRMMDRRPVEISESVVRDIGKGTAVAAVTKDGWELMRFRSIADAARLTGMEQTGIAKCMRGEYRTVRGLVWRRVGEYVGDAPVEDAGTRATRYAVQMRDAAKRGEAVADSLLDADGFLRCAEARGFRETSVALFPHGGYGPGDMEVAELRDLLSERHAASRRKVTRIGKYGEPDMVYGSVGEAADDVIAMGLCNPGSKRKSVLGRISAAKCNKIASAYGYQWR